MPILNDEEYDLNTLHYQRRLQLNGANAATVQLSLLTAASPSAFVVTIKRSNDGENWAGLESAQTIAFGAFSSAKSAMTAKIDCSGFDWIAAEVTTAEGAALIGRLVIFATRTY